MEGDQHLPWFERAIRDAVAAGEFDEVKGSGEPIADLDRFYEPGWWARRFLERERRNEAAASLARELRDELPRVLAGRDEAEVRARLEAWQGDIGRVNQGLDDEDRLPLLDIAALLDGRRRRQS